MADQSFEFDERSQRYRITKGEGKGRFLSQSKVKELTEATIDQSWQRAQASTNQMIDYRLTVGQWEVEMAGHIRQAAIAEYAIGKGGIGRLSDRDYAIIQSQLRFELGKLREFSNDILSSSLSEAQIRARAQLYLNKTYGMYERGRLEGHRSNGYMWERRKQTTMHPCVECNQYSAMGWMPIGTLPNPTEACSCKANCGCYKEFSNSVVRPS